MLDIRIRQLRSFVNKFSRNPLSRVVNDACVSAISKHMHEAAVDKLAVKVAKTVKRDGYVLVPGALEGEVLEKLSAEFEAILKNECDAGYQVDRHDGAVCVRVKPLSSLSKRNYPATCAFYSSEFFLQITQEFYSGEQGVIDFNGEVFVHQTPKTNDPLSGALHWDRKQTLKFWIYLDDVPVEAGPMRVAVGTSPANREVRKAKSAAGLLKGGVDNLVVNSENVTYMSGPKGTILIHDSDSSHGAGAVRDGYFRKIMRGHCRLIN